MKILFIRLIRLAWYLFAATLILAAILVSLAHLLTPLLNKHRHDFEIWASELLQAPIRISEVHADWRGNIPELTLAHVVVLDKVTQKPVFDFEEMKFGFQLFSSLWERKIVLQDIIISGTEVTVLQDAAGSFSIKDLPLTSETNDPGYKLSSTLNWLFSQPYLALRNIDTHFLLHNGEKREFTIKKVSLVNQGDEHRINGNFTLHQEIPTEVKARIEWKGRISDPDHIKAQAYLNLEGISLGQWLQGKNEAFNKIFSGWEIHQGLGGADLWLDWDHNQLQRVQSVFQWYNLEFYSIQDKKTYPIEHLSGHVGWKREGLKQIFAGDNLLVNFPNHLWPATTFYVVLAPQETTKVVESGQKKAKDTSAEIVLETKKLRANSKNKEARKAPAASSSYSVKLDESLAYAEEGVKKSFAADDKAILRELRIGYLNLQDILPIILANSTLPADWHKKLMELEPLGEVQNLVLSSQGDLSDVTQITLSGEVNELSFNSRQAFPGFVNVTGRFDWNKTEGQVQLNSKELAFNLPSLFPEVFSFDYLSGAFKVQYEPEKGWSVKTTNLLLSDANVNFQAMLQLLFPLKGSPNLDLNAEFSLAKVTQIAHYLPAKIMDAALVSWLKEAFLSGRIDSGKVTIQGRLADFPFDPRDSQGEPETKGKFEVSGVLKDVDFHYAPAWPILQQTNGRLIFSGRSMTAIVDSAFIMDVPVKQASGVIPYLGEAQTQVVNVDAKVETDLAKALDFIHQSPLEAVIGKDLANLQLKGPIHLALSLSVPLANPDKTKVLGKVQLTEGVLGLPDWNITLDQLNGAFQFTEQDLSAKYILGNLWGEPTVLRLATIPPAKGRLSYVEAKVSGKITVAKVETALDLSLSQFLSGATTYQALLKLYKTGAANNEVQLSSDLQGLIVDLPAPFGKPAALKRDFNLAFVIQQTAGFKTRLRYGDLIQAQLNIVSDKNTRVIDIDSNQLKGKLTLSYPFDAKQPIIAQLDRLVVSANNEKTISSMDPRTVPPLVINTRQFIYGTKNLGQLTLNTSPKLNGMTIQNFSLSAPDYTFQAKGQWTVLNHNQQSQLQGTIQSSKVNRFLDRLGLSLRSLLVDKGRAAFDLQWKGAPYGFSLATTSGDFSFALERGRIINLNESDNNKMDMGRMLSLFSLQTIPRRLSLDFSDLFEKGYSFDFMRGDFSLKQGSAFTQKAAVFEGPVAHVTASGRIGLLARDYDLTLSISPYVTESLPVVAGALTLNPFVGAAAWVVNKMVLSKEVSKVITYNYKVTGSWNAPVWQSINKPKR